LLAELAVEALAVEAAEALVLLVQQILAVAVADRAGFQRITHRLLVVLVLSLFVI
jgi:hypothetical protein